MTRSHQQTRGVTHTLQRAYLVPHKALTLLNSQNRTEGEDRLALLLPVFPLGTLIVLNGTLLALDVLLHLRNLVCGHGIVALVDLHVAVELLGSVAAVGGGRDGQLGLRGDVVVVVLVLGARVDVRARVAVVIRVGDLLVARPRGRRRRTAHGAAAEELRVGVRSIAAHRVWRVWRGGRRVLERWCGVVVRACGSVGRRWAGWDGDGLKSRAE